MRADGRDTAARLRAEASAAAQRRLDTAHRLMELTARPVLFERALKVPGAAAVKVRLTLPGPVLVVFDPRSAEVLARSLPGRLGELDLSCLDE